MSEPTNIFDITELIRQRNKDKQEFVDSIKPRLKVYGVSIDAAYGLGDIYDSLISIGISPDSVTPDQIHQIFICISRRYNTHIKSQIVSGAIREVIVHEIDQDTTDIDTLDGLSIEESDNVQRWQDCR